MKVFTETTLRKKSAKVSSSLRKPVSETKPSIKKKRSQRTKSLIAPLNRRAKRRLFHFYRGGASTFLGRAVRGGSRTVREPSHCTGA